MGLAPRARYEACRWRWPLVLLSCVVIRRECRLGRQAKACTPTRRLRERLSRGRTEDEGPGDLIIGLPGKSGTETVWATRGTTVGGNDLAGAAAVLALLSGLLGFHLARAIAGPDLTGCRRVFGR